MKTAGEQTTRWRDVPSRQWAAFREQREEEVFLLLTLLIGALVGAVVVAFIVLTERFGTRLYPGDKFPHCIQTSH